MRSGSQFKSFVLTGFRVKEPKNCTGLWIRVFGVSFGLSNLRVVAGLNSRSRALFPNPKP